MFFFAVTGVAAEPTIWRLDNLQEIGGNAPTVWGEPQLKNAGRAGEPALEFDGVDDGLLVPNIPFAGSRQFTIEILFQPSDSGSPAQRFLHAEDSKGARALIELRLDGRGEWWLDTFIVTDVQGGGVTLIDPARRHPTGRWHWAALRYDGRTMAHFVNGVKELERGVTFQSFGQGATSLGVRQNKVYWYKGAIREVRFHAEALPDARLQRIP